MILLEELDTEFGNIKIVRSRCDGAVTYYQDECFHSQVSTEGESLFSYIHVMHSLIRQVAARRVLMIGCAGGTLATMLHRRGCEVTVLDVNPHAFKLAKKYFQFPKQVECIVEDGQTYLLNTRERFDAIAVDAFDNHGEIPKHLVQADFFHIVRKVLQPQSSLVVMNVILSHDFDPLAAKIVSNMQTAKLPPVIFNSQEEGHANTIIAGGSTEQLIVPRGKGPAWVRKTLAMTAKRPNFHDSVQKIKGVQGGKHSGSSDNPD